MSSKDKYPMTLAIRELLKHKIEFSHHPYAYEEHGGTKTSARELRVDEHAVIKTLVMETETKDPLIVLMHVFWYKESHTGLFGENDFGFAEDLHQWG